MYNWLVLLSIDTSGNPFANLAAEAKVDPKSDGVMRFFDVIRDWYAAMIVIGFVGLVCVIAFLGIKLIITRKSQTRTEIKDVITWKLIIAFVICNLPIIFTCVCIVCEKLLV